MTAVFSPAQRRELVDAAARSRIAYQQERAAAVRVARPKKRKAASLPTKSEPMNATAAELALADRLLGAVCVESVVDRRRHAIGVARMILMERRRLG